MSQPPTDPKSAIADVRAWAKLAESNRKARAEGEKQARESLKSLLAAAVTLNARSIDLWRVIPLGPKDQQHLAHLAAHHNRLRFAPEQERMITRLGTAGTQAARDAKWAFGVRRFFAGATKRGLASRGLEQVLDLHEDAYLSNTPAALRRAADSPPAAKVVPLQDALDDYVGFRAALSLLDSDARVLNEGAIRPLLECLPALSRLVENEKLAQLTAQQAGQSVTEASVRELLAEMPVDRLREATRDRLRVGPLTTAGITTVQRVLDREQHLESLPGIGPTTAMNIRGAARTIRKTTMDETPLRIDINARAPATAQLLQALRKWDQLRRWASSGPLADQVRSLVALSSGLPKGTTHLLVVRAAESVHQFEKAASQARRLSAATTSFRERDIDPWPDFMERPADYYALLSELGFLTEDEEKVAGQLPKEIVEAVRRLELDTSYLQASLRGYQRFGAGFAVVQQHVVIGDEMGLGKTVEALAALAHLKAQGGHHFVVICPASVVTNWYREIASKSRLVPHRVHGPGRQVAAENWRRQGGVAVTTFETLRWFDTKLITVTDIACVVVDEAHYIKNPESQRSQRTNSLLRRASSSILMTGTPLENRVEEFKELIRHIRPDLAARTSESSAHAFRAQVAPVYLRRNQEDVLTELPDLIEVNEWVPMSREDEDAYRRAVADGNFMAMRQSAMLHGTDSPKLSRLIDLVAEAEANGRRVIVFSYFRQVLDIVARALPGDVYGPLTGSVPAQRRQQIVDNFSRASHGAVLVAQIEAGGVGLNIQAASVVVICEPQLKPSTEWQAIARARRMGQLQSVQVHRLLSEEGVDRRVTEILARKKQTFEDFARRSETASAAPEAYDLSESELVAEVIEAEQRRLYES